MCCQVEISSTDWSLVQMSPNDCGASLCLIKKPRERGSHSQHWAAGPERIKKIIIMDYLLCLMNNPLAVQPKNWGSIPSRFKGVFCHSNYPKRIVGSCTTSSWGLLLGMYQPRYVADHSPKSNKGGTNKWKSTYTPPGTLIKCAEIFLSFTCVYFHVYNMNHTIIWLIFHYKYSKSVHT
jgi:hypothetical protein